jgi:hypothetical protein
MLFLSALPAWSIGFYDEKKPCPHGIRKWTLRYLNDYKTNLTLSVCSRLFTDCFLFVPKIEIILYSSGSASGLAALTAGRHAALYVPRILPA